MRPPLLVLLSLLSSSLARHRREEPHQPFVCPKGRGPHLSCQCSATFVRCTNAQLRDAEIFVDIATRFPKIREIAVNGNSLMGLRSPIFATPDQKSLRHLHRLIIPNNYLVELHPDVFLHAPNIHFLDLSFNEIKLDLSRAGFLRPLSRLRHLVMRKGFSRPLKYDLDSTSRQLALLEREFQAANLTELEDLDLSFNFIRYIPVGFGCALAGTLKKLVLDGNELAALSARNVSCLFDLTLLSLQRNLFARLDHGTRRTLTLFPTDSVQLAGNKLRCDCEEYGSVGWLRVNQTAVGDWTEMVCGRWNPATYGAPVARVPSSLFTCASAAPSLSPLLPALLFLLPPSLLLSTPHRP